MRQQQHQSSLFLGLAASAIFVSLIVLVLLPRDASSFLTTTSTSTSTSSTARTAITKTILNAATADVPSWKDLSSVTQCDSHEQPIAVNGASYSSHPDFGDNGTTERPILYRERHGWCPYSERVWLALEVKGIEYDTIYIDNIYGRPR